jgi:hypothetical protein
MNPTLTPPKVGQINKARDTNIQAGLSAYSEIDSAPFSASLLGQQKPMKISPPRPATSAIGFGSELSGLIAGDVETAQKEDELKMKLEEQTLKSKSEAEGSGKILEEILGSQVGEAQAIDQAYSAKNALGTTVDETAKKLKEVSTKINAIDIRLNEQIKQLEKNTRGLFGGALQQEIDKVTREAASNKADLYIEKLVAQGDFDSAKNIADRKVDVLLEQQRLDLENIRADYERNLEEYDKDEQREFNLLLSDRESKLAQEANTKKAFEALKIDLARSASEQGAPQAIKDAIARATTSEQAINAAGQYGGDMLARETQRLQNAKITEDIAKTRAEKEKILNETVPVSDADKKFETLALAEELRLDTAVGKKSAIGASLAKLVPFGQALGLQGSRSAFENKINTLKSSLTLENLKLLKGSMSDKDLLFLNSIGSSLSTDMSEASFNAELDRIISKLKTATGVSGKVVYSPDGPIEIID